MRWVALALMLVPRLVRADYADGEVPAAMNAFTQPRHALHLSLLGTSAFGITEHTEIAYDPLEPCAGENAHAILCFDAEAE